MATAKKSAPAKKTAAAAGTAVAVRKPTTGAVANIQDRLAALAAKNDGKTAAVGGNKIRITQDKKFILPDGSTTPGPLELVVVDFASYNSFYPGAFDKNNIQPPACFAIGDIPVKLVPSDNSPEKQADSCAECPMNAFGSAGDGKACKNNRILAVLPPGADAETPMWVLAVSPTGLKNWDGYVNDVKRMFVAPPLGVITTVAFDDNQTYARLTFGNPQPNPEVELAMDRLDEAGALLAQEPDVSGYGVEKPQASRRPVAKAAVKRPVTAARR